MKVVKLNETQEFKNSDTCVATEYSFNDETINIAVVKITGRYPDKGRVTNEKSKEVAYVIEGKGKVFVDGKEIILQKGDSILIEPTEQIYWEGNMTMLMPCVPAWSPEQHKYVD